MSWQVPFTRLRMVLDNYTYLNEILEFVNAHGCSATDSSDNHYNELVENWNSRNIEGIDAGDIKSTLRMIELVDGDELSDFGEEILENWNDQEKVKNLIAKKMIIEKDGWAYCHILFHLSGKKRDELQLAYQEYYDADVAAQLTSISKYNIFLSWLDIATEEGSNYKFDTNGFKKRIGFAMDEFDSRSELDEDAKWCYLALIRLSNGTATPIGISDIKNGVENLTGKFQAELAHTIGTFQRTLEEKGLITTARPTGSTSRGSPTDWTLVDAEQLNTSFAAMLETFFRNEKDLRSLKLFDKEFDVVVKEMDSPDIDTRGRALETFAAKVCWILGIRNIEIRKMDRIERDVVGNRRTPFFTNFLVQCKNQRNPVGPPVIVKELGTAFKEKYNNIMMFSPSGYVGGTQDYCNEVMVLTGVNIYLFNKEDIDKIIDNQGNLLAIISEKNKEIEITRSNIDPLIESLTKFPDFVTHMKNLGWKPPDETAEN